MGSLSTVSELVGNFVRVSGLTSAEGSRLNGKIGVVRSLVANTGRVGVECIGERIENGSRVLKFNAPVALKKSSLSNVEHELGNKILAVYLNNKMHDVSDPMIMLAALEELMRVPGVDIGWEMNATMISLLRGNGRVEEALTYCAKSLTDVPHDHEARNRILYDYAMCLWELGRLQEAFDLAVQITTAQPYDEEIKREVLVEIALKSIAEDSEPKEKVVEVLKDADVDWKLLCHNRGAAKCRNQDFVKGIRLYEFAIAAGSERPDLKQALDIARMQLASKESGVGVYGRLNGSGVYFKQM